MSIIFLLVLGIVFFNGLGFYNPSDLTMEQKIGQLFIIGIEGTEATEKTEKILEELHPGGILLLGKNIESEKQLKKLISDLQEIAKKDTGLPLFIAVDQEGGLVNRITFLEEDTAQKDIKTKEKAYQVGFKRGKELKNLGINLNFSPVLDDLEKDDYIFERGFSEDIKEFGKEMVRGYKEAGIISCTKHFPGYGGVVFHPENNLGETENLPEAKQFKDIEADFVMTSNVVYNELDDVPFSFSKKGIDFLKQELGQEILIITDDLDQYSLLNNYSLEEIVSKPLEAGVDMMIFSGWRLASDKGVKTLKNQEIDETLINRAVNRIIKLKQKLL